MAATARPMTTWHFEMAPKAQIAALGPSLAHQKQLKKMALTLAPLPQALSEQAISPFSSSLEPAGALLQGQSQ